MKASNYNSLATNEFVSDTYAQKKYLGWKDKDILANREFMRKDAEMQWELAQIQAAGPDWKEQAIAGQLAGGGAELSDDVAGGGAGGGIPEFGGGEADVGDTEDVGEVEADSAEPVDNVEV